MRIRTAKQRAQRIDLHYFKHAAGLRRWRVLLSAALPLAALAWIATSAAAGNRLGYSAGPVAAAHAFAEPRCEVCHATAVRNGSAAAPHRTGLRAHATDAACLTCHDAPAHAPNLASTPACSACHEEHRGRVRLSAVDDGFCVQCHAAVTMMPAPPRLAAVTGAFASGHPEFAAIRGGAHDPARLRFNHAVHLKADLRGPSGPEQLGCEACHRPEVAPGAKRPATTGLMTPIRFEAACARCHPLFFDERIVEPVPHAAVDAVRKAVRDILTDYIGRHPEEMARPDAQVRRVPLNFPRPPEPPARTPAEWIERRASADERLLWNKTCTECHELASPIPGSSGLPHYLPTNLTKQWMPRAAFTHAPHQMVQCASCHAAQASTKTSDVLMPNAAVCATCHAGSRGSQRPPSGRAESRCFECHRYHDWTKTRAVTPAFSLQDFK